MVTRLATGVFLITEKVLWEHGSWASTCFLVSAQTRVLLLSVGSWMQIRPSDAAAIMDICLDFGGSTGHEHQHRTGHSKTMDPNMALRNSTDPHITIAPDGSTGHLHHCGPLGQHCPQTSTWLQAASQTTDIPVVFSGNTGYGNQHTPSHSKTT